MKGCGDNVLNSRFYRVGGESCAQSLPKSLYPATIISWVVEYLADACLRDHASKRAHTKSGLFPVMAVRMRFLLRLIYLGINSCERQGRQNELGESAHAGMSAISLPFRPFTKVFLLLAGRKEAYLQRLDILHRQDSCGVDNPTLYRRKYAAPDAGFALMKTGGPDSKHFSPFAVSCT